MSNIFDMRSFKPEEVNSLKAVISDNVECLRQIKDLQEHMKENNKGVCGSINKDVVDPDQMIKPKLITKMAKARLAEEKHQKDKDVLDEVDTGLQLLFK